jgi:hypothetical protein
MLASGMLITLVDQPSVDDHKVKDELLDELWAARAQALGREDKIEAQIVQDVTTLESVCRPVLQRTASGILPTFLPRLCVLTPLLLSKAT